MVSGVAIEVSVLTGIVASSSSLVSSFAVCASVIGDNEASFASVIVNVSVDCDIVVSSRLVVVFSVEMACNLFDFITLSCVSAIDGDPDAVDSSDDFPVLVGDVTVDGEQ